MIRGSCLCGAVRFELDHAAGPFELCHCGRCRKVSGSAFLPGLGVHRDNFRWLDGRNSVQTFDAPLLHEPPAYRVCFCTTCGSPVPDPQSESDWFEIPAGLLDDDPQLEPQRHIFTDAKAPWHTISDVLPQLDRAALMRHRRSSANLSDGEDQ